MYFRHNSNFEIYNNTFIRSTQAVDMGIHPVAPYDLTSTGLIAYNTVLLDGDNDSSFLYDEATNGLTVKNNLVVHHGSLYADYVICFECGSGASEAPFIGHDFDSDPDFSDEVFRFSTSTSCTTAQSLDAGDWQALGQDTHSLFGTGIRPTFVDEGADDYHLATGSVGRSAGTPISGITTDMDGRPRSSTHPSMGAYE